MKTSFFVCHRDLFAEEILDPDIRSSLDGQEHLLDCFTASLDLHGDRSMILVSDPSGTAEMILRMPCPVAKAYTLHLSIEDISSTDHLAP